MYYEDISRDILFELLQSRNSSNNNIYYEESKMYIV